MTHKFSELLFFRNARCCVNRAQLYNKLNCSGHRNSTRPPLHWEFESNDSNLFGSSFAKKPTGTNGCFALLLDGLHPRLHLSIPSIFISLKLRYLWKQVKIRWNFASSPRASLLVEHVAMACYGSYVPIPQRHAFAVSPFPWEGVIHLISKSERGSLLYYLGPRYWYCRKTTVKNDWSSCKLSRSSSI